MSTPRLVIVDGVRTPFCKMGTSFAQLGADELGRIAVNALLTRTGIDPGTLDEVIFGCVAQPIDAANVARVIALRAGIPEHVPAVTVHRNCASGLEAITTAHQRMLAGRGKLFIVGGAESMSQIPMFFPRSAAEKFTALARARSLPQKLAALTHFSPSDFKPRIGLQLGLTDPVSGLGMGETAEILAREFQISREQQDEFALQSHQRAVAARDKLAEEICPVYVDGTAVTTDNGPRENQTMAQLAKLKPVFDKRYGTVTAGNASQITDGAAALLVATEEEADRLGLPRLGTLIDYTYVGCDPRRMGLGPVPAITTVNKRSGLTLADADLIEINEAFAAQVISVTKSLPDFPLKNLNPNGGAIALGHPVGVTGSRLALTALKELKRRGARRALVSLCVGGGQGAAMWLERNEK